MKLSDLLEDGGRPVAYYPSLALVLGGVKEAISLCQLIYWTGKQSDKDGWIYKQSNEVKQETGLSWKEQKTARRNLIKLGVLKALYQSTSPRLNAPGVVAMVRPSL
jgi:hypothetical protein